MAHPTMGYDDRIHHEGEAPHAAHPGCERVEEQHAHPSWHGPRAPDSAVQT